MDGGTCRFQPIRSEVLEKLLLAKDLAEYTGGRIVLVFSGRGGGVADLAHSVRLIYGMCILMPYGSFLTPSQGLKMIMFYKVVMERSSNNSMDKNNRKSYDFIIIFWGFPVIKTN